MNVRARKKPRQEVVADAPAPPAPPSAPAGLELRGLVKRFGGTEALRGIDLVADRGNFVTVLGPSGSGKTTILRVVAGFLSPDQGEVLIDGRDVTRVPPASREIGMVFQNYALFPHMTAADNIAYGLKMRRWPKPDRDRRVAEMLELVGLGALGARLPRELSGGQQQRVAVARALAFRPQLLLMDEPLGALDRELRMRMAVELRRLHHEAAATTVYVTHDREEALTLSDWIVIMHDGRIDAMGTAEELYTRPRNGFVASFFGGHNVAEATMAGVTGERARVGFAGCELEVACGQPLEPAERVGLSIPEEALGLTPAGPAPARLELHVLDDLYLGNAVRVTVRTADGVRLRAVLPHDARDSIRHGGELTAYLDTTQVVAVPHEH
ncbi:ABC transporter ATP-binding protein [Spongiactinospora sp. TRM90649]|uniref:ABC transporter ATP-binding protein n=1 Tax=Spongiactinospora sp. TRM90649 TaxID=3031114 RepID=UPI0023F70BAC|nr:ABC transporter ATP-binding protein [Spongiactinospora sp. TRM90649]MDF5754834.1 ABC transporter ATP-binding protein [Spongiactinospora sp. TRM90649]